MKIFKIAQTNKDLLEFKKLIDQLQELPKSTSSKNNKLFELLGENDELPFKTRMVRNEIAGYIEDYSEWVNLIPEDIRNLFSNYTFSRVWK